MGDDDEKLAERKWKYQTVEADTEGMKEKLNPAGQQGWELVTIIAKPGGPDRLIAVFKKLTND